MAGTTSHGNRTIQNLKVGKYANVDRLLECVPGRNVQALIATIVFAWCYPVSDPIENIDHYLDPNNVLGRFRLHFTEQFARVGKIRLTFVIGMPVEGMYLVSAQEQSAVRLEPIMEFDATNEAIAQLPGAISYHGLVEVNFVTNGFTVGANRSVLPKSANMVGATAT